MTRFFEKLRSQAGASLVEYALIASLVLLPSVAAMNAISGSMNDEFDNIEDNAASAGHGTTTTLGTGSSTTTTTSGASTTSTTTTAPPSTTSSTTSTTSTSTTTTSTTTSTTTTTAPPSDTETVNNSGGEFTFQIIDGDIVLTDYHLNWGWSGSYYYEWDGDLVINLYYGYGGHITMKAKINASGDLVVYTY